MTDISVGSLVKHRWSRKIYIHSSYTNLDQSIPAGIGNKANIHNDDMVEWESDEIGIILDVYDEKFKVFIKCGCGYLPKNYVEKLK